jgi:lipoprotein NlpI
VNKIVQAVSISLVLSVQLLTQGCSTTSPAEQLTLAEPLTVNYKSEVAIARLSEVILRAKITEGERAQLYYDRGVIYDSVGLSALARLDFTLALRLKPDLVNAYNFLGIQYTQRQEFIKAYESFDSAIELAPEHEYAYLNRGISLYYGGRSELAFSDFSRFHKNQNDDPYRAIWIYFAEKNIDEEQAKQHLKEALSWVKNTEWAKNIMLLYVGDLSESTLLTEVSADINTNKELAERLCEAYFYLAKYNLYQGNKKAAENYFKLSLSTNVYEFVEHRYARLELDLMKSISAF